MGQSQELDQLTLDISTYFNKARLEMKNNEFALACESFKKVRNLTIELRYWARMLEEQPLIDYCEKKLREIQLNGAFCKRRINENLI